MRIGAISSLKIVKVAALSSPRRVSIVVPAGPDRPVEHLLSKNVRLQQLSPVLMDQLFEDDCKFGHGVVPVRDALAAWGPWGVADAEEMLCLSCNALVASLVSAGLWSEIAMITPIRGQFSAEMPRLLGCWPPTIARRQAAAQACLMNHILIILKS